MKVEVVYALAEQQTLLSLDVVEGCTARQAIIESGMLERYPQIHLEDSKIGIFGHVVSLDQILLAGERVEIYRPITCDPKEVRRQRAELAKKNQQKSSADNPGAVPH